MSVTTILWIILAGIIAMMIAIYQYMYKAKNKAKKHLFFAFLRFLTVGTLLVLIINPKFKEYTYYTVKPILGIMVDNSASIDHLKKTKTVEQLIASIINNKEIQERFEIETFSFADGILDSNTVDFKGKQTHIAKTLQTYQQIHKNDKAPMVLISDGNQTYGQDYQYLGKRLQQPIFPVIIGDTIKYQDLKIQQLNVNKYAYLKNDFPVEAIIVYDGAIPIATELKIYEGESIIYNKPIKLTRQNNAEVVQLKLPANSPGVHLYRMEVTSLVNEKNKINNAKNFAIEVIDQKTKIAILSDIVHPDLGAIKKSIESNDRREVVFKKISDQIAYEEYQLVVIYQPTPRFSQHIEALKKLKINTLTITGMQTDWDYLNRIQKYYNKQRSNQKEEYQARFNTNYGVYLTKDIGFDSYPPLQDYFGEITFLNAHEPLLFQKVNGIELETPLMTTYEVNEEKHAVLFGEGLWKWRTQEYVNQKDFRAFDDFFGRCIQFLASNKKRNRLDIVSKSFYYNNESIKIQASYFSKNYEFDNRGSLTIRVKNKDTEESNEVSMILKNNYYEVDLSNLESGDYEFTVSVSGEKLSRAGSFSILNYDVEQQFLNPDVTKLSRLATNTSGKVFFEDQAESLMKELTNDNRFQIIEKKKEDLIPLIEWKYVLGFLIVLLAIEWFSRKYNGMI